MNGNDQISRMSAHQGTRRLARDGPHGGGDETRLRASIGGVKAGTPQLAGFDHVRIHAPRRLNGGGRIIFEEIDHLDGDLIFVFKIDSFDDGFSRGTMSAAGIGKVKNNMGFSRSCRLVVHVVLQYVW